jgi:hypothetical protein
MTGAEAIGQNASEDAQMHMLSVMLSFTSW